MEPNEFRECLKLLGFTQAEAAERLGVDPRTVRRWVLGEREIPGPVEAALTCWLERAADEKEAEVDQAYREHLDPVVLRALDKAARRQLLKLFREYIDESEELDEEEKDEDEDEPQRGKLTDITDLTRIDRVT